MKLKLVLKGKWYDMIESGEKTEEYREISYYWVTRLCHSYHIDTNRLMCQNDFWFHDFESVVFYHGYSKDNCLKTKCIQGGIGYWQKVKTEDPKCFNEMAALEHELTELKGEPVTMLKDQSKGGGLVFLKPHPKYPHVKDISMMKGRPPKPLMECNGFCGTNDFDRNETEREINFQTELFSK